jgi:cold shock CspA family protein
MTNRPLKELLGLRGAGQIHGEAVKHHSYSVAEKPTPRVSETGTIVRWFPERIGRSGRTGGFGFLKPDGANHDLFFHVLRVIEGEARQGARVEFKRTENPTTKQSFAIDITVR